MKCALCDLPAAQVVVSESGRVMWHRCKSHLLRGKEMWSIDAAKGIIVTDPDEILLIDIYDE